MLDFSFGGLVKAPVCVAPMFLVSGPDMVSEVCDNGLLGSFSAHSTRDPSIFEEWLDQIQERRQRSSNPSPAPFGVNLVLHETNKRLECDLEICERRQVPIIMTSKGAPKSVFGRIHEYGGLVFHDVASARHAEKAASAGADALIAIAMGAGGKTGKIHPFALFNEIRQVTDLPIILAGGMSTGRDAFAATALGAEMIYVGTRFQAAKETLVDGYTREILIKSNASDIFVSSALDGAPSSWLAPSLINEGYDLRDLHQSPKPRLDAEGRAKARYSKIRSAGQGVGMIQSIENVSEICQTIISEFHYAQESFRQAVHS